MIKKILLYIRGVFQNASLIDNFKLELVELDQDRLFRLLELYT